MILAAREPRTAPMQPSYRLGFAVKVLGGGGFKTSDTRRWQSEPHLSRSLELLEPVLDELDRRDLRMFRLSSSTVPYGTHPNLPQLDYRRQIESCRDDLGRIGEKARAYGIRLSTHPGQYTVLNAADDEIARKAALDLEQDAALLDALGAGPEAVVVVHVGGAYGDPRAALGRFARRHERLSDRARERVAVEHDETSFDLGDVLWLSERTGARVIFDMHHHRCLPAPRYEDVGHAVAAACATWPAGVRPKLHLSSPRTELRVVGRGAKKVPVAPLVDQHADFVTPWDLAQLLSAAGQPVDVMLEAKAKDLAVEWVRLQMERLFPALAEAEERAA